jgi:hypothetical protein
MNVSQKIRWEYEIRRVIAENLFYSIPLYYGLVDIVNKKSQQLKINSLFLQIGQFNGTEFESNSRFSDIPFEAIILRFHVLKHFNKVF